MQQEVLFDFNKGKKDVSISNAHLTDCNVDNKNVRSSGNFNGAATRGIHVKGKCEDSIDNCVKTRVQDIIKDCKLVKSADHIKHTMDKESAHTETLVKLKDFTFDVNKQVSQQVTQDTALKCVYDFSQELLVKSKR